VTHSLARRVDEWSWSTKPQRRAIFSVGVVGPGTALYAAAMAQGHEGVMAKHLASRHRLGRARARLAENQTERTRCP
jgi:ATP-dependent DNA ligase